MNAFLSPWPWWVAGPLLALVMTSLLWLGHTFGMSSNLRTLCAMAGAGRCNDFFRFPWKGQTWNLVFALGALIGGLAMALSGTHAGHVHIDPEVATRLTRMGLDTQGWFAPVALFGSASGGLPSWQGLAALIVGGFFMGFGARWAGGCTSGHAITGLSDMQKGSLFAVIGFFAGGLIMTWWLLPLWFAPGAPR